MSRRFVSVLAAAWLAAACTTGGAAPRQPTASSTVPTGVIEDGVATGTPSGSPSTSAAPPTATAAPGTPGSEGSDSAAPSSAPSYRELAMNVTVTPTCVGLGGTAEVNVESDHGVQVVWGAVYDGGEGGADPPFGSGHGGSGSGIVGEDGMYVARWTVRPSAPTGPAHVIVQAGYGDRYGYREIPFEVVGAGTNC